MQRHQEMEKIEHYCVSMKTERANTMTHGNDQAVSNADVRSHLTNPSSVAAENGHGYAYILGLHINLYEVN